MKSVPKPKAVYDPPHEHLGFGVSTSNARHPLTALDLGKGINHGYDHTRKTGSWALETTEKIVEAYVRYVKGWATIPNLRCAGQKEIDLFAIDPVTDERWHIETSVSISSGFSKLTNNPYEPDEHKHRVRGPAARRKLGFFIAEKFLPAAVNSKLTDYGCKDGGIRRAIVTWDCKNGVVEEAKSFGIEVWLLPDLMREVADLAKGSKAYLSDDTLRTLTLFDMSLKVRKKAADTN